MRAFLRGSPTWQPGSSWPWTWAAPAALLIFLLGQALGIGVVVLVSGPPNASIGEILSQIEPLDMRLLLAGQIGTIVLTVLAAYMFRSNPTRQLRLVEPDGGLRSYVLALLVMLPLLITVNAVTWAVAPDAVLRDFMLFKDLVQQPNWLLPALAIAIGAPLSEELLFRGFLLSSVGSSRLGYWPSATLVALSWTMLHASYSAIGMIEVFVIGMYLSWTLKRTGSLLVPLFCHAVYNASLFMVLRWIA